MHCRKHVPCQTDRDVSTENLRSHAASRDQSLLIWLAIGQMASRSLLGWLEDQHIGGQLFCEPLFESGLFRTQASQLLRIELLG